MLLCVRMQEMAFQRVYCFPKLKGSMPADPLRVCLPPPPPPNKTNLSLPMTLLLFVSELHVSALPEKGKVTHLTKLLYLFNPFS